MKAKEYFDKYETRIMNYEKQTETETDIDSIRAANELMYELNMEAKTLMETRNVSTDKGMVSVLKEFNQKWNTICSLFEEKYEICPLLRNGYKNYWIYKVPELASVL